MTSRTILTTALKVRELYRIELSAKGHNTMCCPKTGVHLSVRKSLDMVEVTGSSYAHDDRDLVEWISYMHDMGMVEGSYLYTTTPHEKTIRRQAIIDSLEEICKERDCYSVTRTVLKDLAPESPVLARVDNILKGIDIAHTAVSNILGSVSDGE